MLIAAQYIYKKCCTKTKIAFLVLELYLSTSIIIDIVLFCVQYQKQKSVLYTMRSMLKTIDSQFLKIITNSWRKFKRN